MKDLFSLEGKTALVTGGSTGIGAMIAEGFVNFGAKVYIVARREKVLKEKQEELIGIGGYHTPLPHHRTCGSASGGSVRSDEVRTALGS